MDRLARILSKYPFLLPIILSVIALAAIGWYINKLANNITVLTATEDAGKYSTIVTEFRNFYSKNIIPNLKNEPGVVITHDYMNKPGAVPFPATMSIDFSDVLSKEGGGASVRVYSNYPWPWRKDTGGPHDEFEKNALSSLQADPSKPYIKLENYNGEPSLRYATAIVMQESCLGCHNNDPESPIKNWKVGDVRGAQEIILPLATINQESRNAVEQTLILMIIAALGGLFLLYLTLRGLKRSLRLSEAEVEERKKAEMALAEANTNLENRVELRTKELNEKNVDLQRTFQELKQTQQQMIVQEKMASLGQLTAGIAHEIKNPLNFVNNFSELSIELIDELREILAKEKDKMDPNDAQQIQVLLDDLKSNSSKINTHGKRADGIVKDMLLHSRGISTEKQETDLNLLLEEYLNLAYHGLRAQDSSFNVKMEKLLDPNLPKVNVFPQEIGRAFLNIINNALYSSNEKRKRLGTQFMPVITLASEQTDTNIIIKIKDNGEGINKTVLNKIFNPFFTTKPTGVGTGLGLSITYDIIVQEHQGKIEVNTEPGEYTEFVITLPKNK